ncbi:hypothetical protein LTR91_009484 [Friedmanniomyces endolithicus]|uniref:Integral membrane protein TmpA n=1 Tax=Friedmanniomyces endolithicus TaxID=329885 RepID=A0AAN6QTU7_9PEZI|nr:hypothetical protein LTR59_012493 [Friedmanniomyces endolithicus]KAK0790470.1 hypothetical protein LTR38_010578 [Friedmanniomyces endolithicus]KAK0840724.1 hypothetical protein LTR03_010402 [Friedmanniomyces endolithicus]KAK0900892.1 hypothetical protein LTR57_020427 [Friedmanniomyces endolithicus]KAK0912841.1 hypothetical protein LTR02_002692 [Friedmanniomyces endolithicus]
MHTTHEPPQLPNLHFGRRTLSEERMYAVPTWIQSLPTSDRTGPQDEQSSREYLLPPDIAHITPKSAEYYTALEHRGRRRLPSFGGRSTPRSRIRLDSGVSASALRVLARLPVSEQLVWVGIDEPARVYRPWSSRSWDSFSSGSTLLDNEKYDVTDLYDDFGDFREDYAGLYATQEQLRTLQARHPLPWLPGERYWKSLWYRYMTAYRWLMALVLLSNVVVMVALISLHAAGRALLTYPQVATATGANLLATILMRQEHVINVFYHLAYALPQHTPLQVRRFAASLTYNYGGVHAGAAISALLWYTVYAAMVGQHFHGTDAQVKAVLAITAGILVLFVTLILLSHPSIRRHYHNQWELSHRYGGWTAVALVWAQTLLVAVTDAHTTHQPLAKTLLHLPTFYFLLVIMMCLLYPWLRLKRLPVRATYLSTHATRLNFTDRTMPTCRGVRLARNPFLENHGFATIPNAPPLPQTKRNPNHASSLDPEKGYSILISNAGDFTRTLIQHPPSKIWLRGAPTTGVMRLSSLFRPLVIVATGSGIGPCLSFLNTHHGHPLRVLWSARFPAKTYGNGVVREVLRADPRAVVVDTGAVGCARVDLVGLAFAMVREVGAEAVMVISNPKVTGEVVSGMERRGVAAFGAVFDS